MGTVPALAIGVSSYYLTNQAILQQTVAIAHELQASVGVFKVDIENSSELLRAATQQ